MKKIEDDRRARNICSLPVLLLKWLRTVGLGHNIMVPQTGDDIPHVGSGEVFTLMPRSNFELIHGWQEAYSSSMSN